MKSRTLPRALCLLLVGAAAACTGADATGPEQTTTETRWDMDVVVRYVKASSDRTCDGENLLGVVNPGEYQFRIEGSFGPTSEMYESANYGSVTGRAYTLGPGELENFANKKWTFRNLAAGDAVTLRMRVTEWDGTDKDDYMNDRDGSLSLKPSSLLPAGGSKKDRALGVGKSTCGLTLYYDIEAVQRQVEIG